MFLLLNLYTERTAYRKDKDVGRIQSSSGLGDLRPSAVEIKFVNSVVMGRYQFHLSLFILLEN
jgi:hypothetical protein